MKNAALLVTVLAACATDGIEAEHDTPTTPLVATVTSTADGAKPIVATGGALAVRIEDKAAIGLEGSASAGYRVELLPPLAIGHAPMTDPISVGSSRSDVERVAANVTATGQLRSSSAPV
jgi:hypothetical protein